MELQIFNPETFDEFILTDKFIAQQRTSKHKQFVFMYQDCVIKGPYKEEKYNLLLERYQILKSWDSPEVVYYTDCFLGELGYYFKYPNLMSNYQLEFVEHNESFTNLSYKILANPPVKSLNKYKELPENIYPLLLSLCHCYILGVGDTNTRNILISDKAYLIDIDDSTTQVRQTNTFYFSKDPAKKLDWYNKCKHLYTRLSIQLSDTIIPEEYLEKANLAIHLLTINQFNDIGLMNWTGLRGQSKTFSGIDFDVAKSGLQKYIRRQESEKAVILAFEMYRLAEVGGSPGVTNLYNRLAVIANEDVSPNNLGIILAVTQMVQLKDHDLNKLLWAVDDLSKCSKTRLMSQAWRTYGTEQGQALAKSYDLNIDLDYDQTYINKHLNHVMFLNDSLDMKYVTLMFLYRLQTQDYNAFTWASIFLAKFGQDKVTARAKFVNNNKYKTSYADILLWRALSLVLDNQVYNILVEAYYNHSEKKPFLQNAILITINNLHYQKYELKSDPYPRVADFYEGNYQIEIDDYVVDKHTRKGRLNGKTIQDFVDSGAVVIPQDMEYYAEVLEEIYRTRY